MPNTSQPFDYEPLAPARGRGAHAGEGVAAFAHTPRGASVRAEAAAEADGVGRSRGEKEDKAAPAASTPGQRLKRGHALAYAGLLLFSSILYFRPQEYIAALAPVPIAFYASVLMLLAFIPTQLAVEGTLTARPREVNLLLLLSLAALLSVPLAISPGDAINTFWDPFLKAVIVFVVFVNVVRTERRLKGMLLLALAVTCTLSVGALNDYRLGNLTVEGYRIRGVIKGGMFENTNDLGIHLVTMVPLALALGFGARNLLAKAFYWACALLALATIVITFSRGGFLGLVAVAAVLAWKLARRRRARVVVALLAAVGAFVLLTPPAYWLRIASICDSSLDPLGSSSARSALLKQSFLVALRHPLFGIGMGNFPLVSIRSLVSHNSYTQVAAEMGLGALLCYTMFIVAPLRKLREIEGETLRTPEQSRFYHLAVGLQASLVGYMVSSFFAAVAYYWFVYYLVGYAVCFRRIFRDARARAEERAGAPARRPGDF